MATNRSLRAVREQIPFAYAENIIDADEFLLLYDANQSKPIYPFGKNDLYTLLDVFNVPNRIIASQGTACSDIEALCILLKRLAFPCRYSDMTPMFGRNMTKMCLIYNKMVDHI